MRLSKEQDAMGESLYKQNLSEWIFDEKKLITYHYLSVTLGVHVNLAKQMLYEFYHEELSKQAKGTLEALFYVSGIQQIEDNENDLADAPLAYTSALCAADKLDDLKNKLSKIYSVHIYSVKHSKSKVTLEEAVSETLELSNDGRAGPEFGPFTLIKPQNLAPQAAEKTTTSKSREPEPKARDIKTTKPVAVASKNIKKEVLGSKRNSTEKPLDDKPEKELKTTERKPAGTKEVAKDGGKDRLKNMFAAVAANPKEFTREKAQPAAEVKNVSKGNDASRKRQKESNSRSSNSKQRNNTKPKPEVAQQRRRIKVFSSSDESDSDSNLGKNDDNDEESDSESPIPKRRQIQSDTESEDANFQGLHPPSRRSEEPEKKPALPPSKPGRKRVTKTVTKRVVDEDGYTVVKKEQVVVSESESDSEEKKARNSEKDSLKDDATEAKAVVVNSKPNGSNRTKTTEATAAPTPTPKRSNNSQQNLNGKAKQASITSFFQKKA